MNDKKKRDNNQFRVFLKNWGLLIILCIFGLLLSFLFKGGCWCQIVREFGVLLSGVVIGIILLKLFFGKPGKLDRALSASFLKQLVLLSSATFYLLVVILIMSWQSVETINNPNQYIGQSTFNKLIATAYRFFGFNYYYEDSNWINFFMLLASLIGTSFMGGLVVTTLSNIVQQRKEDVNHGRVRYKSLSGHYVIIGFDQYTIPLIKELFVKNEECRILIMTAIDVEKVRAELNSVFDKAASKRIFIYLGSMTSVEHLKRLNINVALDVYVLGDGESSGEDSMNIECARLLKDCRWNGKGKAPKVLRVNILFNKAATYSTVRSLSFPSDYYTVSGEEETAIVTYLRPFNFYENCACRMWGYAGPTMQPAFDSLDFKRIEPDSSTTVHLVIAGFNNMGKALLLEALRVCHYPNFNEQTGANKTLITVVDPEIEKLKETFISLYPQIDRIEDIQIEYRSCRVEDNSLREEMNTWAKCPDSLLTIAICFYDPDSSYATALHLPDSLYYRFEDKPGEALVMNENVRILVRRNKQTGIGDVLANSGSSLYRNVRMFGSYEEGLKEELFDDTMPMLVNAYYSLCYYNEKECNPVNLLIGQVLEDYENKKEIDFWTILKSKPSLAYRLAWQLWYMLDEDHRFSNRYQIEMYKTYEKYEIPEGDNAHLKRMEHLRWNAERRIMGYIQYPFANQNGTIEDSMRKLEYDQKRNEFKLHHLLIPYKDLPVKEKTKDQDVIVNRKIVIGERATKGAISPGGILEE